jgi:hypothetical protein
MSSVTIVAALVIGIVCGLVPLIYGLKNGLTGLAIGGFVASVVAGLILGIILALPVAALFTWLIWRQTRAARGTPAPYSVEPVAAPGTADGRFERDSTRATEREPTL